MIQKIKYFIAIGALFLISSSVKAGNKDSLKFKLSFGYPASYSDLFSVCPANPPIHYPYYKEQSICYADVQLPDDYAINILLDSAHDFLTGLNTPILKPPASCPANPVSYYPWANNCTTNITNDERYATWILTDSLYKAITRIVNDSGIAAGFAIKITKSGKLRIIKVDSTQGGAHGSRISTEYQWYNYLINTFPGTGHINTLGTITTGVWNGSVITKGFLGDSVLIAGTGVSIARGASGITINNTLTSDTAVVGSATINVTAASPKVVSLKGSFSSYGIMCAGTTPTGTLQNVANGASGTIPISGGINSLFSWSTANYPATTTINQLLYSSSANNITGLPTANSSVLITSAGGVPSLGTALPNGITATTQANGDNSTNVATTAFVKNQNYGSVTSFSAGNGSPLFTTSVATATTTPALSFTVSNAANNTILGNVSGLSAAPVYFSPNLVTGLFFNQGTTTTVLHGNASGNLSFSAVSLVNDITGILGAGSGGTGINNGANTITINNNPAIFTFNGAYTLTIPATGTAILGTGTNTNLAGWTGTNTQSTVPATYSATTGNFDFNNSVKFDSALRLPVKTAAYTPKYDGDKWKSEVRGDTAIIIKNGPDIDTIMTLNTGGITYAQTWTGWSAQPTTTSTYRWVGSHKCEVDFGGSVASSNSTSSSALLPFNSFYSRANGTEVNGATDAGIGTLTSFAITAGSTTVTFLKLNISGNWSNTANKGIYGKFIYYTQAH